MNWLFIQYPHTTSMMRLENTISRNIGGAFHRLIKLDPKDLVSPITLPRKTL